MRTHNFAKHLAQALAKPATESAVPAADPVVTDPAVVVDPVATTENITPNNVEIEPKDPVSPLEPNQEPAAGATAPVADSNPPDDVLEQPEHQGEVTAVAATIESAVPIDAVKPATEAAMPAPAPAPAAAAPAPAPAASAPAPAPSPAPAPAPATESAVPSAADEAVVAAPGGGTETLVVGEVPHVVENSIIACDDTCDQLDDVHHEAHALHKGVSALESILQAIGNEPNGLDTRAARIATVAVESVVGEWGSPVPVVPSIESFGGEISRREATLTTESNVKEIIKQVIAYLKNLWVKFVELLKKFIQHLREGTGFLEHNANHLKAKAQHISGEPREKEFTIEGSLAARVAIGGKVPNLTEILDLASDLMAGNVKVSDEQVKAAQANSAAFAQLFTADEANFAERLKAYEEAAAASAHVMTAVFTEDGGRRTREFPGGVSYEIKGDLANGEHLSYVKHHHEGAVEARKVDVPSKEAIMEFSGEVAKTAHEIHDYLRNIEEFEKVASASLDALKDNENITEEQAKELSKLVLRVKLANSTAIRLTSEIMIDLVKALTAGVQLAYKAANLYGHPSVAAKAGEAAAEAAGAVKDAATKVAVAAKGAVGESKEAGE
jgi:hypothetical protein